jgi:hypothetical protein
VSAIQLQHMHMVSILVILIIMESSTLLALTYIDSSISQLQLELCAFAPNLILQVPFLRTVNVLGFSLNPFFFANLIQLN